MGHYYNIHLEERAEKRIGRFLELLAYVAMEPRTYAPQWIVEIDDIEDRLFASYFFFGLSQNWGNITKEQFYKGFSGRWEKFTELMKDKKYDSLQAIFKKIFPKGHIRTSLKGYIYGSPKKGGFKKSYPFSYYTMLSNYNYKQQMFYNRDFSSVFCDLQSIKGVRRTLAFDIASGAYVVASNHLDKLEPDRIYLKHASGPLKGLTMLLSEERETRWAQVKKIAIKEFSVEPSFAEEAIREFEKYLVDRAFDKLKVVRPSIKRFEALLELEDLICNYQKPIDNDWNLVNKFLEGTPSIAEYGKKVKNRFY